MLEEIRSRTERGDTVVTVVLPELVPDHWWQNLLHNQTALFFKRILLFEPDTVVTSVPFHLAAPESLGGVAASEGRPRRPRYASPVNIRPATKDDADFIGSMIYEAARWNPDWPRETLEEFLGEPGLRRYHEDWGREGDGGVIAEIDGEPVGAAWYRTFSEEEPGLGFVNEKTPSSGSPWCRSIVGRGSARRCSARAWSRRARTGSRRSRCRSRSHNRSRMMYQRAGFEKVAESGESWTMLANL